MRNAIVNYTRMLKIRWCSREAKRSTGNVITVVTFMKELKLQKLAPVVSTHKHILKSFVKITEEDTMQKYQCLACGYVYDPAENDDIPFEQLPDDWTCPECGVGKDMFEPID